MPESSKYTFSLAGRCRASSSVRGAIHSGHRRQLPFVSAPDIRERCPLTQPPPVVHQDGGQTGPQRCNWGSLSAPSMGGRLPRRGLCSENPPLESTARSGRGFEHDAVALAFERLNGPATYPLSVTTVVVVGAGVEVRRPERQEVVDGDEHGVGHRDDGLLVAAMLPDAAIVRGERALGRASTGGEGGFDQGGAEPAVTPARLAGAVFARALVVPKGIGSNAIDRDLPFPRHEIRFDWEGVEKAGVTVTRLRPKGQFAWLKPICVSGCSGNCQTTGEAGPYLQAASCLSSVMK